MTKKQEKLYYDFTKYLYHLNNGTNRKLTDIYKNPSQAKTASFSSIKRDAYSFLDNEAEIVLGGNSSFYTCAYIYTNDYKKWYFRKETAFGSHVVEIRKTENGYEWIL